jgi:poly-gamma-glutamate synthesis protein (capsule biosynthesis protein)
MAAVGDLLLAPAPPGVPYRRHPELVAPPVRELLQGCDVVFGNLECTLPGDGGHVPTEPRVVASAELVQAVKAAGFSVVSLANNHMFDCLEPGFRRLRDLLDEIGLPCFGAGRNLEEAAAPAILEVRGVRIAFLGAADERSGVHQFATANQWGVAPLDTTRLTRQIRELRSRVDLVIVSLHWGEERFLIPAPKQIEQAHALVDAGASMILGHHPHVLQGLEVYREAPVIYSLGNFVADEVHYTDGDVLQWDRTERTGCVLLAELGPQGVRNVQQVPSYDSGQVASLDESGFGTRRIEKARRALARGVTLSRYRAEHRWVKTVKPALGRLRWQRLKQLRWRQVRKAIGQLLQSTRAD